jgi:hypothetical protein
MRLVSQFAIQNINIKINGTIILPVVFYGVKLCCSHGGREVIEGCSRIGCRGGYLDLRGTR